MNRLNPFKALNLAFLALVLWAGPAFALAPAGARADSIDESLLRNSPWVVHHPDLHHRQLGDEARRLGHLETALEHYHRSAAHADKLAQVRIAEMYWHGRGHARDAALAHAWMALAAERGHAPLVGRRDYMWAQLDESERERSRQAGIALQDDYADEVARPRMERQLRRLLQGKRDPRTLSSLSPTIWVRNARSFGRARYVSDMMDIGTGRSGKVDVVQYDPQLWDSLCYWTWKDRQVERAVRRSAHGEASTVKSIW